MRRQRGNLGATGMLELRFSDIRAAVSGIQNELKRINEGRWIGDFQEFYLQSMLARSLALSKNCSFMLEVTDSNLPRELSNQSMTKETEKSGSDHERTDIVLYQSDVCIPIEVKKVWQETAWRRDLERVSNFVSRKPNVEQGWFVGFQQQRKGKAAIEANITALRRAACELGGCYDPQPSAPESYDGNRQKWLSQEWSGQVSIVRFGKGNP